MHLSKLTNERRDITSLIGRYFCWCWCEQWPLGNVDDSAWLTLFTHLHLSVQQWSQIQTQFYVSRGLFNQAMILSERKHSILYDAYSSSYLGPHRANYFGNNIYFIPLINKNMNIFFSIAKFKTFPGLFGLEITMDRKIIRWKYKLWIYLSHTTRQSSIIAINIPSFTQHFPHPGASQKGGGDTCLMHWKMLGGNMSSDSRMKCCKFAVFPIFGYFEGMLATLSMIHQSHQQIRGVDGVCVEGSRSK